MYAGLLQGTNGEEHGDDAALHVGRAAAEEEMIFAKRLELRRRLGRNDVVVAVEVEGARAGAVGGEQDFGGVVGSTLREGWSEALTSKAELLCVVVQEIYTGTIVFAWRIFRGNGDKVCKERGDFVFAWLEPRENGGAMRGCVG